MLSDVLLLPKGVRSLPSKDQRRQSDDIDEDLVHHLKLKLPDLLPARMLNEFVYCPRLFFYEWVEGVFENSADTLDGHAKHSRVDSGSGAMPEAEEMDGEKIHSRSVTLSSERVGLTAKLDLIEGDADADRNSVRPVDYKRGKPRQVDGLPTSWPSDRIQIAAQALVLRDNGYACDEGILYYASTKQRVRIAIDDALIAETEEAILQARRAALNDQIPPPLVDSPKCPRCSLVGHLPARRDQRAACASTPIRGAPPSTVFTLWRPGARARRGSSSAGVRTRRSPAALFEFAGLPRRKVGRGRSSQGWG